MTNYTNGRAKEYKVRDYLKDLGYCYSIRSAASQGPIDILVANDRGRILAVQVKSGSAKFKLKEMKALCKWAIVFRACPILARYEKGGNISTMYLDADGMIIEAEPYLLDQIGALNGQAPNER
ncbi:MAG: PDDEXK family nuclease [Nitrosotalea sp.]